MLGYRIYTKEDYKRYLLCNSKAYDIEIIIKHFEKHWERMSKGYNFIIGVGKEDRSMMIYSVDYFNDNIVSNKVNLGDYTVTLRCDDKVIARMTDSLQFGTRNNG